MIGLALVAGIFIAFSLASSFLFPRRNPDFPGPGGLRLFVLASLALFVAMMLAVWFFADEGGEEQEHGGGESAALVAGT